jgi:hypothetical protein
MRNHELHGYHRDEKTTSLKRQVSSAVDINLLHSEEHFSYPFSAMGLGSNPLSPQSVLKWSAK